MAEEKAAPQNQDLSVFLKRHRFTQEEFDASGYDWSMLKDICQHHDSQVQQLRYTAEYVTQRLQDIPDIHSMKVRVKDPDHLAAKIVRKRKDYVVTVEDYCEKITDLVGIRALHLFKGQWRSIHNFVTKTWDLHEKPIAYYRKGDSEVILNAFAEANCEVIEHPFGYRSIHYLILSQPDKHLNIVELQVRTLFEEGWSEIDHRVRYPSGSSDPFLADFLTIFNRLAGSADEMGTFIKALGAYVGEQRENVTKRERQLADRGAELKKAISKLKIEEKQRQELERQIEDFRKSSEALPPLKLDTSVTGSLSGDLMLSSTFSGILRSIGDQICTKCGKNYSSSLFPTANPLGYCPDCSGTQLLVNLWDINKATCVTCGQSYERDPLKITPTNQCPNCSK